MSLNPLACGLQVKVAQHLRFFVERRSTTPFYFLVYPGVGLNPLSCRKLMFIAPLPAPEGGGEGKTREPRDSDESRGPGGAARRGRDRSAVRERMPHVCSSNLSLIKVVVWTSRLFTIGLPSLFGVFGVFGDFIHRYHQNSPSGAVPKQRTASGSHLSPQWWPGSWRPGVWLTGAWWSGYGCRAEADLQTAAVA